MQSLSVEPAQLRSGGLLYLLPGLPELLFVPNHLGFDQSDRGLHQRVIQRITDRADPPSDARRGQLLGECQSSVRLDLNQVGIGLTVRPRRGRSHTSCALQFKGYKE